MSKKKRPLKAKKSNDEINYKKLFFEIMFILLIAFGATVACIAPSIIEKLNQKDKYEAYREIITRVDNYDYTKGRDFELEKELDYMSKEAGTNAEAHFYILASGVYYCNVKMFRLANDAFEWLAMYGLDDTNEALDVEAREAICKRKYLYEGNK